MTTPIAAALTIAVFALAASLWAGSELHYRNCITEAKALGDTSDAATVQYDSLLGQNTHEDEISRRIRGCSRIPF